MQRGAVTGPQSSSYRLGRPEIMFPALDMYVTSHMRGSYVFPIRPGISYTPAVAISGLCFQVCFPPLKLYNMCALLFS